MKKEKDKFTDEKLKQIALDLAHGKIFSSQQQSMIDNPDNLSRVFMTLIFFKPKDRKKFWDMKPAMIFEYLNKASPRSCNGLPSFFSFQWLDEDEAKKVMEYHHKLKEAEAVALET